MSLLNCKLGNLWRRVWEIKPACKQNMEMICRGFQNIEDKIAFQIASVPFSVFQIIVYFPGNLFTLCAD